ncbi:unnamed protein product [Ambrosiozyma monospora]|uniref:Unnamed protein product n=1 Tax=Ambrosiozyma monospora TaxID=43982 RepID=A0ACB5TSD6_AMBMO|nr:unnamed protein product [Ambrosiozyma monospora]
MDPSEFNSNIEKLHNYIQHQSQQQSQPHSITLKSIQLKKSNNEKYISIWTYPISIRDQKSDIDVVQVELNVIVSFNVSYSNPVLSFRIFQIVESSDDDGLGMTVETRKVCFRQVLLYAVMNRSRVNDKPSFTSSSETGSNLCEHLPGNEEETITENYPTITENGDEETGDQRTTPINVDEDFEFDPVEMSSVVSINDLIIGGSSLGSYYFIHPCQTTEFLKNIDGNTIDHGEILVAWWMFYSRVVL